MEIENDLLYRRQRKGGGEIERERVGKQRGKGKRAREKGRKQKQKQRECDGKITVISDAFMSDVTMTCDSINSVWYMLRCNQYYAVGAVVCMRYARSIMSTASALHDFELCHARDESLSRIMRR